MLQIDVCPRDADTYYVGQYLGVTLDKLICLICQVTGVDAANGLVKTHMFGADLNVTFNFAGHALSASNMMGDPVAIADADLHVCRSDFPADIDPDDALEQFIGDLLA